jgi:hypothetical protein
VLVRIESFERSDRLVLGLDANGVFPSHCAAFTDIASEGENQRSYYQEHLEIHCYDVTLSDIMEKVLGVLAG